MVDYHAFHLAAEATFSILAISCSLYIIFLAMYRTKNKAVKVYSQMLVMNACVDLGYSLCNLIGLPIFYIYDGLFFLSAGNPLLKDLPWSANIVTSFQGFLIYVSVVIIPIQFMYRYSVITNKPYTSPQLIRIFMIGITYPLFHGILCFYTFKEPSPEFDKIFIGDPVIGSLGYIPPYRVGDCANSKLMAVHMSNCMVMTVASYIVIMIVYQRTREAFIRMEPQMTEQTKKVQKQMERVIFIQAVFPIVVLFIPGTVLPIASLLKINVTMMGEFVAIMHTTPVFNSFSVVLCVPTYRRTFLSIFCRPKFVNPGSSNNKNTHTNTDSDVVF
ncbi:unnamed protein product [Bursaphelenchus xylophilus]|uniref:(pine wood nematode) hypothetical protein n=1 Tax=Bursaphelenchus xylophilus TaxID=6326 RepID=A0A1I7RMI0_BURXY|nr:unnamed protein product [Bursaphelenchus xylophilus]CAG9118511.1 unnamed protein product [Bursaphelenchus xylophilus]